MGWSEHYESSFSQVLHRCLLRLCSESLPVDGKVEIDGIVCITVSNTDKQLVLKIHDIVDKSRSSVYSANGGTPSIPDLQMLKPNKQENTSNFTYLKEKLNQNQQRKSPTPYFTGAKSDDAVSESDKGLVDLYKSTYGTPLPPHLMKVPQQQKTILPKITSKPPSTSSRRKQSKPQMVTQIPDNDDDDMEALSAGDMENWYMQMASDSDNETDPPGLSSSMPSSLMPYSQHQRPPRQRVPLADELKSGIVVNSDFACRKCNRKFQSFNQLQVHNMELHRRYTCKQCQTTFSLRCNLRRHERLHAGYKPYQCQWCTKTFSRNGDLKIHEWKHKESSAGMLVPGTEVEDVIKEECNDPSSQNGIDHQDEASSIIVIEPTDVENMSSNDSIDMPGSANTETEYEVPQKISPSNSAFGGIVPNTKNRAGSPMVSLLAQNIMKSVSKDASSGGKLETISSGNQNISDSILSSLYTKYISNSPKSSVLDLAQGYKNSLSPSPCPVVPLSKSGKKNKNNNWSSAPASPASQGRSIGSPSPKIKSENNSPKGSPNAPPVPRSQHYCVQCKEWWDEFAAYESHCAGVHGRYPCQYCGQTFSNKNNRARHGRSHTGQKQFSCGECGKSFTRSDILREHQIIHTESYHGDQCQYCGTKITTKKADLLSHIKKCIQLNKYSPSMIQAKMQAAAEGIESVLPLEYTPSKFLGELGLLKSSPNTPLKQVPQSEHSSPLKYDAGLDNLDNSPQEHVSPNEETEIVHSDNEPSVSNNNKGEKTPPPVPSSDTLMSEGGVVEAIPIQDVN